MFDNLCPGILWRRREIPRLHRGGVWPRWSGDGKEIFFPNGRSLWSATVRTAPAFDSDPPRKLFDLADAISVEDCYEVIPDRQRFLMIEKDPFELRPLELFIVPEFLAEMKARLAAAK